MSRVVLVTTSLPAAPGDAAGHFVATEAKGLVRDWDEVCVLAPGRPEPIAGVRVIGLDGGDGFGWPGALARLRERPLRALAVARFVHAARRTLSELGRIDRIVAHWLLPSAYPIALAASAELEVVAHGSDVRLLLALPRPVRRHVLTRLLDHGARFRFVSERLREALCREADARLEEASRVELPPLDLSLAPSRSSARSMLGIARAERLAVIVSRLVADKRVDLALAAANGVGFDQVVVVGDGPERQRLQRAFPSATFLGKLPRAGALAWLSAADVLVSASPAEGAPTVIREARALGVPVVAVAAGDLRRWAALDPKIHVVAG